MHPTHEEDGEMTKPCDECEGWCERHFLHKSEGGRALCENDDFQRQYWDDTAEERRQAGWGNKLAEVLSSIGVTKERYGEIKQIFGMPADCDCPARQDWLNRVGQYVRTGKV